MVRLTRRDFIAGAAASAGWSAAAVARDPGEPLYADVLRYERFGDHRTASSADQATARWIARRLRRLGYAAELQPFAHELYEPEVSRLEADGSASLKTFPIWPVTDTAAGGVRGRLVASRAAGPEEIALVALPYAPNATLAAAGYARPLAEALRSGPAAVIGVTAGPTGEIVALNVPADADPWPVPVALVGSRAAARLAEGEFATLRLRGRRRSATAWNVMARRPGRGRTLIVSTPISGWFTCAGERGAGVALFLALAQQAIARPGPPLLFLATSGHEFEGMGSRAALARLPAPASVGAWLHLGANVAGAALAIEGERIRRLDRPFGQVGIGATVELLPALTRSYAGRDGYAPPVLLTEANAVGDLAQYFDAGYRNLAGIVGAHPLHHTRRDVAPLATTPRLLARALEPLSLLLAQARTSSS